jgi:ABC-type bacteriocin/lantibiotic exporter with double-glycine peptidase domain
MIEDIPFFPQEIYQCGPASMAGIMHYWNAKDSPEAIAEKIYSKSAKGTLTMDMVIYAREKGFGVVQYEGSIPDLKENIDLGYPLIILVDYGFWVYQRNHFMVVIGYNRDGIIVNSGKEQYKVIPANNLLKTWKKTAHWTLLIRPLQ